MAGIKLGLGARVIYFGAVATADAVVATVSGVSRSARNRRRLRQGHSFRQYPTKGRATGGVRCHRFLKGEDSLLPGRGRRLPSPLRPAAVGPLPAVDARRDGSGTPAVSPSRRSDRPLPAERLTSH